MVLCLQQTRPPTVVLSTNSVVKSVRDMGHDSGDILWSPQWFAPWCYKLRLFLPHLVQGTSVHLLRPCHKQKQKSIKCDNGVFLSLSGQSVDLLRAIHCGFYLHKKVVCRQSLKTLQKPLFWFFLVIFLQYNMQNSTPLTMSARVFDSHLCYSGFTIFVGFQATLGYHYWSMTLLAWSSVKV